MEHSTFFSNVFAFYPHVLLSIPWQVTLIPGVTYNRLYLLDAIKPLWPSLQNAFEVLHTPHKPLQSFSKMSRFRGFSQT